MALHGITLPQSISQPTRYKNTQLHFIGTSQERIKTEQDPILCILVAATDTQSSEALKKKYSQFSESLSVPSQFFSKTVPTKKTQPVCLQFQWTDKNEGTINLQNEAENFVTSLTRLRRDFPKTVPCVIISFGRGGLLVNAATQLSTFPKVDAVIEIGTPIPSLKPSTSLPYPQRLYPNPKKIAQFFNVQTRIPYVFQNPKIYTATDDQKNYSITKDLNPHTTYVIINGKQISLQKDLFGTASYATLLGANLFDICQKISMYYQNYRTTWTAIGKNQKPSVLAGILPTADSTKQPTQKELARSAINQQAHETLYGPLKNGLAVSERQLLTNTYKTAKTNNRCRLQKFTRQTA